jgi:predicted Zn-dependent protease
MKRTALIVLAAAITASPLALAQLPFDPGSFFRGKIPSTSSTSGTDNEKIVSGAKKIVSGSTGIGLQQEMAIGGSVAVDIVSNDGGIWHNAEATRRVNLIGKSLARYADRSSLPFRFGILDTSEVNAFSAPGGYVMITRGAYQAAQNDDQLAGVLAHEIIHISRRHALRIISRNEFISGMTEVAGGANSQFGQFDSGVSSASRTLLKTGYDRGTEFDADKRAASLAASAGFAKKGLLEFLTNLQASGRGSKSAFSTHPSLADRISKLQ